MIYDKTTHRWSLEISDTSGFGNIIENYGTLARAERELKAQSLTVYLWIYHRIPFANKDLIEYMLAKDERFTQPLKEALLSQLDYDLKSGGNDVNKQVAIDFKSKGAIPRSMQIQNQVSIETQQILENASTDFNLLYGADYGVRLGRDRYTLYDY